MRSRSCGAEPSPRMCPPKAWSDLLARRLDNAVRDLGGRTPGGTVEIMTAAGASTITWRRLGQEDFPLLGRWLAQPHVARWWNHETSPEAVLRDFGPASRGEEPSEDLLVFVGDRPLGLVQRCRLADYPEYVAELTAIVDVPEGAMSIDYLIGDPERVGRGLGPRMIRAVLEGTWADHPAATCVIVPVAAANRTSWRALEKAGLHRVGQGDMEPDNPIDDPAHYVYRIDRPTA